MSREPGPPAQKRKDRKMSAIEMATSLLRAIQRDPNPNGRWKGAVLSEDGASLLVDTLDDDGVHTFVLTVRES